MNKKGDLYAKLWRKKQQQQKYIRNQKSLSSPDDPEQSCKVTAALSSQKQRVLAQQHHIWCLQGTAQLVLSTDCAILKSHSPSARSLLYDSHRKDHCRWRARWGNAHSCREMCTQRLAVLLPCVEHSHCPQHEHQRGGWSPDPLPSPGSQAPAFG